MKSTEILTTGRTVTRRTFLKCVVAGGATASSMTYMFRTPGVTHAQSAPGTAERLLTLTVNGQQRRVDVLPQETLAMTLRYKLGLTGTRLGCDRAECGACTVLLDDVPHYACSILSHQVRGRSITTIEGVSGSDGALHPVQQAVVDETGFQCAFCASGFIMSMVGMLKANPAPTRQEAAQALSGNICRCGDYNKILNSAMRAAQYTGATT